MEKGIYKPYTKPNDKPCYVHNQLNHPPGIIKNIPKSINKRLSKISANKEVFDEESKVYQDELDSKGYNFKLEYDPTEKRAKKKRKRTRKISWFNPPYSKNVKTNVGAKFLSIISKNFPKSTPSAKSSTEIL